jgi:ketosteroid isomerase-like protein
LKNYFSSLEGMIPEHNYELVDSKVQVYGDVAILTLQYHSFMPDGQKGTPWKATSVYRYADGDWQVVHAHWSLVKVETEPEAEAEAETE